MNQEDKIRKAMIALRQSYELLATMLPESKGVEITEADFQQATAMPQRLYINSDNPCRKHQYLNVEGSVLDNLENLVRCAQ